MKKIRNLLLVAFMLLTVNGCGKDKCECPTDINGNLNGEQTVIINDYSELYKNTVQSIVMIRVQKKNDKSSVISFGSGVVTLENENYAYIYSNAHVFAKMDNSYEIEVLFSDENGNLSGSSEIATLVGKDEYEDVAVLKINKSTKYKKAVMGDSSSVSKGDWIYTIGSPLGIFNYTTSGNISSVNTAISLDSSKVGVNTTVYAIMFDAAINEGNSGGALLDSSGKLIGITTLRYDDVYGIYGALPINYFDKVAKYLISNYGRYIRPSLSVELLSVDQMGSRREEYGISNYVTRGAYVKASLEQSIDSGKVIIAVNNVTIKSTSDFGSELLKYKVGDTITLTLMDKNGINTNNVNVVLHV